MLAFVVELEGQFVVKPVVELVALVLSIQLVLGCCGGVAVGRISAHSTG